MARKLVVLLALNESKLNDLELGEAIRELHFLAGGKLVPKEARQKIDSKLVQLHLAKKHREQLRFYDDREKARKAKADRMKMHALQSMEENALFVKMIKDKIPKELFMQTLEEVNARLKQAAVADNE